MRFLQSQWNNYSSFLNTRHLLVPLNLVHTDLSALENFMLIGEG